MEKASLKIGQIYYFVQYAFPKTQPEITTFVYKGTLDGKTDTHFFKSSGMSESNLFLESKDLNSIMDISALKSEIVLNAN